MELVKSYFAGTDRFWYLLVSLVALVILDGLITNLLVQDGLALEGNPFLRSIVGGGDFVMLKGAGALLCALILWDIHRHWRRLAVVSTTCLAFLYAGIVIWNLSLFFV